MSTAFATDLEDYQRRELAERVAAEIDSVRRRGDEALLDAESHHLGAPATTDAHAAAPGLVLTPGELDDCMRSLGPAALEDLRAVQGQERRLAQAQRAAVADYESDWFGDSRLGVRHVPFETVGLCVPDGGGSPSAMFAMQAAAIAAHVAGVKRVVACVGGGDRSPGTPPAMLVAALTLAGVNELYRASGARGLAALSVGTESIPRVDLPLGLGDGPLAEAQRQLCAARRDGAAGLVVIADESADAELVAADLIAAVECDPRARGVLITTSPALAANVANAAERQLRSLPCAELASRTWSRTQALHVVDDREAACALADRHALARVEVMTAEPRWFLHRLNRCGELFLGAHAAAPLGDTHDRRGAVSMAGDPQALSATGFMRAITYHESGPGGAPHRTAALARHRRAAGLEAQARACELRAARQLGEAWDAALATVPLA